jgi:hypothetical protein
MSDPIDAPDPDLDDLRRVDLAELDGPACDTARVLDDWLARCHGVTSSHHYVGTFLDLLAAEGWRVSRIPDPGPIPPNLGGDQ